MILADKISTLRKRNGWSQEELAEKMCVSRQAVSKWESAQSIPDLDKILQLSTLFGVTTDYLLKDEIEDAEFTADTCDSQVMRVSLESANGYLALQKKTSIRIALATVLCILSPVALILLGALSEISELGISETVVGVVGFSALFGLVLCAVSIFILCGFKNEQYSFLDKNEPFELEYGVKGIVTERLKAFRNTYVTGNIIATCLCVFSPLPLIISAFFNNPMLTAVTLALLFVTVSLGTAIFIVVGIRNASMQKLLKEGEYTENEKAKASVRDSVGSVYWGIVTAVYLLWSFLSGDWHITWICFVIGGVLSPVVTRMCDYFASKRNFSDRT